jgi:hypothetical protein
MKDINSYIISSLLIFLWFSCDTSKDTRDEKTHIPSSPLKEDSDLNKLDMWLMYHDLSRTDFDTLEEDTARFIVMKYEDHQDLELYREFFIFSPDSTKYIDLDSYSLVFERVDGALHFMGSGPDTEVAVVNLVDSTRKRILFCGPSCIPEDASWLGNNKITIFGLSDPTGNQFLPFIHIYDLNKKTVARYVSDKPGKAPNSYIEEVRLSNINRHVRH